MNPNWKDELFDMVIVATAVGVALLATHAAHAYETPDFTIHHSDMKVAEAAWQTANVVDWVLTIKGPVEDPCYLEQQSAWAIGSKPNVVSVVAFGAFTGVFHYAVSGWLDTHAPRWVGWAWQAGSMAAKVDVIHRSFALGIRLGAPNHPTNGTYAIGETCYAPAKIKGAR
jgi:hypothetical protein